MNTSWINVEKLELIKNVYVSCSRHFVNKNLTTTDLNKKKIKRLLVNHFDEDIWLNYLRDQSRSQMFF